MLLPQPTGPLHLVQAADSCLHSSSLQRSLPLLEAKPTLLVCRECIPQAGLFHPACSACVQGHTSHRSLSSASRCESPYPCWTGGSRIPAFDSKVQCPHAARLPLSSWAPPVKASNVLGSQEETSLLPVVQSSNLSPSPLALAFSSSMASFFHRAAAAGCQPGIETMCSGLCRGLSSGLWHTSVPLPLFKHAVLP